MAKETVLVVEDEAEIRELLQYNLSKEGYSVVSVSSGDEALYKARADRPGIILLDLMLPGIDGLEVCRRLRSDAATKNIPIVMLTAKGEESDIVVGLELGADDYIAKPFSPRVLIARLRAVLRRNQTGTDDMAAIHIHNITIHPGRHEVLLDGERIELTPSEFRLLQVLAKRPGWVFTRTQIAEAMHGDDYPVTDRSVDVHIVALRKKLGASGAYIKTVRGVGYKLKE